MRTTSLFVFRKRYDTGGQNDPGRRPHGRHCPGCHVGRSGRGREGRVRGGLADLDRDAVRLSFDTKVIGPLMLAKHLAPGTTLHVDGGEPLI